MASKKKKKVVKKAGTRKVVKKASTTEVVKRLPNSTTLTKLGFTATDLKGLSPRAKRLTRADLLQLATNPSTAPAKLNLSFRDLQGLHAVAAEAVKTGGGGGGDGGIRCCCCVACCCCCCAVSVTEPSAVAVG